MVSIFVACRLRVLNRGVLRPYESSCPAGTWLVATSANAPQGFPAGALRKDRRSAVEGVRKEPLLVSSPNSRIISTPALISLNENKDAPTDAKFNKNAIPVAMLLQGKFTSLYRNKLSQSQRDSLTAGGASFKDISVDNKVIVVADGDILLNDFIPGSDGSPQPIQMGWNKYTYTEYLKQSEHGKLFIPVANREFLLNCVEYLASNPAISETRNKDIVLRLLDTKKVNAQKTTWQFFNIALPVLLVILFGWVYQEIRKRKYAA